MRFQITFFTAILIFSVFLTGCTSSEAPNANTNQTNGSTNAPKTNANGIPNPTKAPEAAKTNDAPTFAPVVRAYYDALKKKDDAGVRKVMSQDFIKQMEQAMAEAKADGEKVTTMAAFMAEGEPLDKPLEVRNEVISGDKATAEIRGGNNINWTKFSFAKENGEWKFTNKFEDVDAVKQSVSNSNTAK
jgi:hypothetical protein